MACTTPLEILADPIGCAALSGAQSAGNAVADAGMTSLANAASDAFGRSIKLLFTGWINMPTPDLTGTGNAVHAINSWTTPLAAAALILGLIVTGGKLAWAARFDDTGRQAMRGILRTVIVVGAGGLLVTAAMTAFDAMARDILNGGFLNVNVGQRALEAAASTNAIPILGPGLAAVGFGLALLGTLGQCALMLLRGPVLILLCGVWPVTAAASLTNHGDQWFKRVTGWLLSWSLYKLVAALVYATAFYLFGASADLGGILSGLLLLALAALALPALIRIITPAIAAVPTGGGAGAAAAETAGAVAASGAVPAMSGGMTSAAASQQPGGVTPFSQQSPSGAVSTGAASGGATSGAAAASTGGAAAGVAAAAGAAKVASSAANNAAHHEPERTPA